jgi:OmcA/MtrC family decaheme c-type cytochrome
VRLTGVTLPPFATMLTCGLGYSYNVTSTLPLTQVNLATYPLTVTPDGGSVGGLSIPAPNIWRVATGYTGRRNATSSTSATGQIVSPAKCNNCHNLLGVSPSFHAGQRNDGPTCAWCHTQNRTSAGWSAGSGSYIHAIHGAGKRTVPFNWRAIAADEGFFNVKFPGRPQMCEGCHNPGYYDFSNAWYTEANRGNRLLQTVGQGTYNGLPTLADGGVNKAAWSISPYVVADGGVSYGSGFSYSATTQVSTNAAPTTLVNSPISNNCFGCHDSNVATAHMEIFGGSVYEPRSVAQTKVEQCLICHGPGKIAAIKTMHYQ